MRLSAFSSVFLMFVSKRMYAFVFCFVGRYTISELITKHENGKRKTSVEIHVAPTTKSISYLYNKKKIKEKAAT